MPRTYCNYLRVLDVVNSVLLRLIIGLLKFPIVLGLIIETCIIGAHDSVVRQQHLCHNRSIGVTAGSYASRNISASSGKLDQLRATRYDARTYKH